jgi:uncharacterized protein Veg
VILAKAYMQMKKDWTSAKAQLVAVVGQDIATTVAAGKKPNGADIKLAATYGEIFDIVNRNGDEAIYTVQYSVNDGSGGANAGNGEVLNFPYKGNNGSPGGCCGFFIPNQDLVNSFRTSGGLPLLDGSYDIGANQVKNDQDVPVIAAFTPDAGPLDPRLDWTVGRRGINYWDWGKHTGADWIRKQSYTGPYSPKKQVYKKSQTGTFTEVGNWTSGWTANGYRMIRYADVVLLLAECEIQLNDLPSAFANINLIRTRAANPAGFVMDDDGITPNANYVISNYPAVGTYPFDNQANALIALQMERKLELGMEGHRFFDLNRWGNTQTELNRILDYQETLSWGADLYGKAQAGPNSHLYPVPQRQIDLSSGKLVQNR